MNFGLPESLKHYNCKPFVFGRTQTFKSAFLVQASNALGFVKIPILVPTSIFVGQLVPVSETCF